MSEKLTTVLLDRPAHHAVVITTRGTSFRMRKRGEFNEASPQRSGHSAGESVRSSDTMFEKLTTALLDRLAHHAVVIATRGKSFRMRKRGESAEASAQRSGCGVSNSVRPSDTMSEKRI